MEEIRKRIEMMNIFHLRELNSLVVEKIGALSGERIKPAWPGVAKTEEFRRGDMIEFRSKSGELVRAIVTRLNDKSLSCHVVGDTKKKWRVGRTLVRLVGADKPVEKVEETCAPAPAPEAPNLTPKEPGCLPTAEHAGSW